MLLYALLSRELVAFPQHHIPWAALVSMLVSLLDFRVKYLAWFAGCTPRAVPVVESAEKRRTSSSYMSNTCSHRIHRASVCLGKADTRL